jgi:hypothetical protein
MTLSALIHKNKTGKVETVTVATIATQETETPPTVAKVASVTVANPQEVKNEALLVVCYTPAGNSMTVQARDAEHAEWLQRMNPKPTAEDLAMDSPGIVDDRRHCTECANLSHGGRCLSAWRGEILAGSHYKPIDDLPRRCTSYAPKANDPDQRTGAERWPGLNQ